MLPACAASLTVLSAFCVSTMTRQTGQNNCKHLCKCTEHLPNLKYIQIDILKTCVHCIPFAMLIAAHAKLLGASFHAAAHHQPISRFKDVQWAGHTRIGHRANKNRDVLSKTTKEETEQKSVRGFGELLQKCLSICFTERCLLGQFSYLSIVDLFPLGQL